jgi:hypothetical protein
VLKLPVVPHCYLKPLYGSSELRKDLEGIFSRFLCKGKRGNERFVSLLFGLPCVVYTAPAIDMRRESGVLQRAVFQTSVLTFYFYWKGGRFDIVDCLVRRIMEEN